MCLGVERVSCLRTHQRHTTPTLLLRVLYPIPYRIARLFRRRQCLRPIRVRVADGGADDGGFGADVHALAQAGGGGSATSNKAIGMVQPRLPVRPILLICLTKCRVQHRFLIQLIHVLVS